MLRELTLEEFEEYNSKAKKVEDLLREGIIK